MKKNNSLNKKKISTRLAGLFLLLKALLPLLLFSLFLLLISRTFSPKANTKLNNVYNHEIDVLEEHFSGIELQIDKLKGNYKNTVSELLKIKQDLLDYKNEKSKAAIKFWKKIETKLKEQGKELKHFKDSILKELNRYIESITLKIETLKSYLNELINFKNEVISFLAKLKEQFSLLNDMSEFLETLDVVGVFDEIIFEIPELPKFPTFPTINWSELIPDYQVIVDQAIQLKESAERDINHITKEAKKILTPPDLTNLIATFNPEKLVNEYIDPIQEMGNVFNSYWKELETAKILINDELKARKDKLNPLNKLITWCIISWAIFAFITYLAKLKDRLRLAFRLLKGDNIEYSFKQF